MKIFMAGPRRVSILNKQVIEQLEIICAKRHEILIGDANGVDKAVQNYLNKIDYRNVTVYAINGITRNNAGKWIVKNIEVSKKTKDFMFYAAKDIQMVKDSDSGFLIWNGKSKGTLFSVCNLLFVGKPIMLFFTPESKLYRIKTTDEISLLIERCEDGTKDMYNELLKLATKSNTAQLSFDI